MTATTSDWVFTNKLLMDICDFDKSLFDTSTLSTEEIRYYNSITRGFDKQIEFFIDWLDSDEARRIFNENESYNERVFDRIDEEIKSIVGDTSLTADEIITSIYDSGLQHGADEIKRTKYYNDATKFGLEFLQDYNFSLISNVNEDLKNHIRAEIFTGIAASESMPEVANRILHATDNSLNGKTLSARQRAMMIARTETARAMTQGRLQSYANYGVQEVKILTAGDSSVCAICREAESKIFPISEAGNLVPFHPLCRCSVMAYIRHGILQKFPDSNAQPTLCSDNETKHNQRFNSTKIGNSNSGNVIGAEEEFNNVSRDKLIKVTREDGSKKIYYVKCTKKNKVNFPEDEDMIDGELCYKYELYNDKNMKKSLVTFYRSHTGTNVSFSQALKIYDWLPPVLKEKCREIVLSRQDSGDSAGYVHPNDPNRIILLNPTNSKNIIKYLTHEMAHSYDFTHNYVSDYEYGRLLTEDMRLIVNDDFSRLHPDQFFSDNAYYDYIGLGEGNHKLHPYAEDFADTVENFLINPFIVKERYPNKANYLKELLS